MPIAIPFSLEPLLRRYPERRRRSLQPIYERMAVEAGDLVRPATRHRQFAAAQLPRLAACLAGVESLVLGLCTLGPDLDTRVSALFKDDPVAAVVLDEIGTLWIKALADAMYRDIRAAAQAAGQRTSPSYRPGIGRWPLELQRKLFQYLPTAEIGVTLLEEGSVMMPPKTISMIVGVGTRLGRSCYAPGQPDATPLQQQLLEGETL